MASGTVLAAIIRALRPAFRDRHDRVVFAAHAFFLSQGYTVVAVGPSVDGSSPPPTAAPEAPLDGWNGQPDWYAFQYVDPSGAKPPLLLKCLRLGGQLLMNAVVVADQFGGHEAPRILELDAGEWGSDGGDVVGGFRDLDGLAARLTSALGEGPKGAFASASNREGEGPRTWHEGFDPREGMPPPPGELPVDPRAHPGGMDAEYDRMGGEYDRMSWGNDRRGGMVDGRMAEGGFGYPQGRLEGGSRAGSAFEGGAPAGAGGYVGGEGLLGCGGQQGAGQQRGNSSMPPAGRGGGYGGVYG
ncbi:unnamed protein product [Ostreobium quekettii]|uniref:PI31 proteasome regulator N-terminal domain-containing protein n=1 Tax=Ostreobium quekettii TaxID=121088 RepID=A0A8S1IJL0_9CHLO|nr:unnamed protein product [Ostreobium quekettii]|eukprot:evm.model.scf_772EXC.9 EVM.evm.TU.scf_772EXC.9   scf_772EXC:6995-7894(+)